MKPGIYFNLSDADYFGGTALGSTDLKTLCKAPADWWYGSAYNPDRIVTSKSHFDFGKALHSLVLEGENAFDKLVTLSPFDSFRTNEAKAWKAEQEAAGRAILTADEIKILRHMTTLIHKHPDFSSLPTDKWLKEVAVFWYQDGVLMRAKFDALKVGMGLDLKTYGGHNTQGRSPFDTAMRIVANLNYDVQRAHYARAYIELIKHVHAGLYLDANDSQAAFLKRIADQPAFAWIWLFYQVMDNAKANAPVVMPVGVVADDASHRSGDMKIRAALANYKGYMAKYGVDVPWAQIEKLRWADDTDFVLWMSDVADPQFNPENMKEAA